jgi:putative hemolysin
VESETPSPYLTGFAVSRRALEAALKLRYEVFNLELGEGLSSSEETGLDEDQFDSHMTQLILIDKETQTVVGTYRMQTMRQALASPVGSYSGQEYDLDPLRSYFDITTECGRACLAKEHRKMKALIQLWLGIGTFMNLYQQKYLFGCCSLSSTNPRDGWLAYKFLEQNGFMHPEMKLLAKSDYYCSRIKEKLREEEIAEFKLPKLFKIYLRLGASVISQPALDRNFKTIDFLVLLKASSVNMSSLGVVH